MDCESAILQRLCRARVRHPSMVLDGLLTSWEDEATCKAIEG
jgi:hypothetical protein